MRNTNKYNFRTHLSEQQLVDYLQERTASTDLPMINRHVLMCPDCADRLSGLILFAAEIQLLKSHQHRAVDDYLAGSDHEALKKSFINRVIMWRKQRRMRSIKI